MSAIQIVTRLLSTNAGVQSIATSKKVFPIEAPQNTEGPYITVNLVSGSDERLVEGPGRYYLNRVTVESIGRTASQILDLGDAALAALEAVVKQTVAGFSDVDVYFADVDFTQSNDSRTAVQRVQQFMVKWRR